LRNLKLHRQLPVPVVYKDVKLECGYRLDLVVDDKVIVESKCIEAFCTENAECTEDTEKNA